MCLLGCVDVKYIVQNVLYGCARGLAGNRGGWVVTAEHKLWKDVKKSANEIGTC